MKRLAALIALLVVAAACSTGAEAEVATLDDQVDGTSEEVSNDQLDADAEEAILAFARCMRDNGVSDFPDPELDANGNLRFFGGGPPDDLGVDEATLEAAFDECSPLIEGIIQNFRDVDVSELEDTFLEFAGCMREQGIEMPDPDFSQGFGPGAGGRAGIFGDLDPQDPEFQAAAEECQGIFEGGFGPGGGRRGAE